MRLIVGRASSGARIYDLTAPASPVLLGTAYGGASNIALIGDAMDAMTPWSGYISHFDVSDPASIQETGITYVTLGDNISLAAAVGRFWTLDNGNIPRRIPLVGSMGDAGTAYGEARFLTAFGTVGLSSGWSGVGIWDLSSVDGYERATADGSVTLPATASQAVLVGDVVWVMGSDGVTSGLYGIDIGGTPAQVGYLAYTWGGGLDEVRLCAEGGYLYIAIRGSGLRVVDVSTPSAPVQVGELTLSIGYARDVTASGGLVAVAAYNSGVHVVDVSIPTSPALVATISMTYASAVLLYGDPPPPDNEGEPAAVLRCIAGADGQPDAALDIFAGADGQPDAAIGLVIVVDAQPTAPARMVAMAASGLYTGVPLDPILDADRYAWAQRVEVSGPGIDASKVRGTIAISHGANEARICTLSYAGTVSGGMVGGALTVRYAIARYGTTPAPWVVVFTGYIESFEFAADEVTVTLTASDGRGRRIERMTRGQIDGVTPAARWSDRIFSADNQGLDYLADRLSTWLGSVHLSPAGQLVSRDLTFGSGYVRALTLSQIVADTLRARSCRTSEALRSVDIDFTWSWPRLAVRRCRWAWDMEDPARHSGVGSISADPDSGNYRGQTWPTEEMVKGAVYGTGWDVAALSITTVRDRYPGAPVYGVAAASVTLDRRYVQDVTETYRIRVGGYVSDSERSTSRTYAAASTFDADGWEDGAIAAPTPTAGDWVSVGDMPQWGELNGGVGLSGVDEAVVFPHMQRDQMRAAMSTAIAIAQTDILAANRHEVTLSMVLDPHMDTGARIAVDAGALYARGQVTRMQHSIDTISGRAVTDVTFRPALALSTGGGLPTAIVPPDLPAIDLSADDLDRVGVTQYPVLPDPIPVDYEATPPDDAEGYISNQPTWGYHGRFLVAVPEIAPAHRQALALSVPASGERIGVAVQQGADPMTITL